MRAAKMAPPPGFPSAPLHGQDRVPSSWSSPSPREPSMHPLLATAVRCARIAGNVILKHLDQVERIEIESKGRFDYVSDVDRMAEEQIRMHLDRAYPDHGIVAEESEARGEDREYAWIIDPLDGTTNFLHGYPMFAVSIAVARRGVLEHAAIYQPLANEL